MTFDAAGDYLGSLDAALECGMAIAYHAAQVPTHKAVIAETGDRSFCELNANANRLVRVLRRHGLDRGSAVAAICSNRAEFLEVLMACARAGLRFTPVNWHLTGDEMAYIVKDCEARALIAEQRFEPAACRALRDAKDVRLALAVGGAMNGFDDYTHALNCMSDDNICNPRLGGSMLYTSGTTGRPKGVYRWPPRLSPLAGALVDEAVRFHAGRDIGLVTGPLYHAAPLNLNAVPALNAGAGLVLMDTFDAEIMLQLIERHNVVFTHVVATMFHRLLRLPESVRQRYDLSSLRSVLHGAAPCPVHIKRSIIEWLGPVVSEYYAATEGGATLVDSETWLSRPGTVGQAAAGSHVRVLNDAKRDVAAGTIGTVYLRAPPEGRFEYFKAAQKTSAAYHENYFTMGDHGYLDDDGYLYLTGRSAETIISGGVNIYPQEVDDVLLRCDWVTDACTVGIPNEEWGEEVKSVVSLAPGIAGTSERADALMALCAQHLARFKCPRSIDFEDELPRLPSGKVQRHKVRARYWQGHNSSM